MMATLNITTQSQDTTMPNIFNIISQLMGITTGTTAGGSNPQNNITSNVNTRGRHFSHFETIGANLLEGFEAFRNNNNNSPSENNNNNNPPLGNNNNNNSPLLPPLPPLGFREGLEGGFNPLPGGNARGLDSNIAALVNALAGVNLRINHVERESNHVKPTKFGGIEVEDPNEWLECYNRIAEANK